MQLIRNRGIKHKLLVSFCFVAVICSAVGVVGMNGINQLKHNIQEAGSSLQSILTLKELQTSINVSTKTLQNFSLSLEKREETYNNLENDFKLAAETIDLYESIPLSDGERIDWDKFLNTWAVFKGDLEQYIALNKETDAIQLPNPQKVALDIEQNFSKYKTWAAKSVKDILEQKTESSVNLKLAESDFYIWLTATSIDNPDAQEAITLLLTQLEAVYSSVEGIADLLSIEEFDLAKDEYIGEVLPSIESIQIYVNNLYDLVNLSLENYTRMHTFERERISLSLADSKAVLDEIVNNTNTKTAESYITSRKLADKVSLTVIITGIGAIFLAIFCSLFVARSLTKPINSAVNELSSGVKQVFEASSQVSSSSQVLAEGSSEQAAAIEETSASMEEMSSMTKQNADSATQADILMRESLKIIEGTDKSMSEMGGSMESIASASEETSKIIKTIDEIAFQTNLLALNAAVEAARAGEAGAGFAVVADEVRNLALRSTEAAKNTADLIEGTIQRVNLGKEIVTKTTKGFKEVADSSAKVGSLVGEIATASQEQAQGFAQVSQAITQMDNITQQNSASAEESAAASKQLSAQAKLMMSVVEDLKSIVDGGSNSEIESVPMRLSQQKAPQTKSTPTPRTLAAPAVIGEESSPDDVIPMGDDDDFEDF